MMTARLHSDVTGKSLPTFLLVDPVRSVSTTVVSSDAKKNDNHGESM